MGANQSSQVQFLKRPVIALDSEAHWKKLTGALLSDTNKTLIVSFLRRCWAGNDKKVEKILVRLLSDVDKRQVNSYIDLTDEMAKENVTWEALATFRAALFESAKLLLVSGKIVGLKVDSSNIKAFGSLKKYSDVDVTIAYEQPDEAAFFMMFFFGAIFGKLTNVFHFVDIELGKVSTENMFNLFFRFRNLLDVNVYSSNGIITSSVSPSNCTLNDRMLSLIKPGALQVIHQNHKCPDQASLYAGVCAFLLRRIYNIINAAPALGTLTSAFGSKMVLVEQAIIAQPDSIMSLFLEEASVYESEQNDLTRLKLQLYSSYIASTRGKKITESNCDTNFCSLAAEWEKHQVLANLVSPDSAIAIQTFAVTVLEEQGHINIILNHDSYFVAYMENLCNMLSYHYSHIPDMRKVEKYANRMKSCAKKISGVEHFSKLSELNKDADQKNKMSQLEIAACGFIFDHAPIHLLYSLGIWNCNQSKGRRVTISNISPAH